MTNHKHFNVIPRGFVKKADQVWIFGKSFPYLPPGSRISKPLKSRPFFKVSFVFFLFWCCQKWKFSNCEISNGLSTYSDLELRIVFKPLWEFSKVLTSNSVRILYSLISPFFWNPDLIWSLVIRLMASERTPIGNVS